jgi:hypothetical protein
MMEVFLVISYLLTLGAWIWVIGTLIAAHFTADLSTKQSLWCRCFIATLILVPLPCLAYSLVSIDGWRNGENFRLSNAAFLIIGLFGPAPLAYFAWHLSSAKSRVAQPR